MSSMTTNMFAPRIWGCDLGSPQARIARQAGWTRSDILWEGLMERGNAAWKTGDHTRAARLFTRAYWVAKLRFPKGDPRRATVLVNLALASRINGKAGQASSRLDRARTLWQDEIPDSIEAMQILPRARSSLFHLRMEARHRDTYHDNMRHRIGKIADETLAVINAHARGQRPAHRMYSRWLGERPNVYDDTRKLLGACLLIVDA